MNIRDKKGSITIFVLVGLLFMSSFLIISFATNVNKSKIAKEQFNIISDIYSHKDGDANAYERAYTALRSENKKLFSHKNTEDAGKTIFNDTSTIELTKTYVGKLNYKIYGGEKDLVLLNYISTNGENRVIDTQLGISDGYQLELKAQMLNPPSSDTVGIPSETWFLGDWMASPATSFLIGYFNSKLKIVAGADQESNYADIDYDNKVHTYSIRTNRIAIDGNEFENLVPDYSQISNFSEDSTILIGKSRHTNDSDSEKNIYQLKIWDLQDNLIRNFIPCYRKSDNVYSMYDGINKVFYGKTSSNTLIKGDDIEEEYLGDLIEETGKYKISIKLSDSNGVSVTKDIILDKPLYTCEYLDFEAQKVYRSDGTIESVDLPELENFEDYTKMEILTQTVPAKVELEYMGYII